MTTRDESDSPAPGLLDTSVILDLDDPDVGDRLPESTMISAVTLAELSAGPHLANDASERARRLTRLQEVEATYVPLAVDSAVARSFGLVTAAVTAGGRSHRRRFADLLIAATAHAHGLPLYTRHRDDFTNLEGLVAVHDI